MPVDVAEIGADFYAWTGHKAYGPTGVGVLHGRREMLEAMPPFLAGGDMITTVDFDARDLERPAVEVRGRHAAGRRGRRPRRGGRLPRAALGMERVRAHELELTAYALERLAEVPGLQRLRSGGRRARAARSSSFALDGIHPHDVAEIIARDGVCVRAGHHCAQPLMKRLGVGATSRASFAVHNTREDIDRLIDGLHKVREIFQLD